MNILVLASGSGGHVYPCLAFINYVKNKHNVTYLKIKGGFEEKVVPPSIKSLTLDIPNQLKTYLKHPHYFKRLHLEIKNNINNLKDVDAIICFGGFVSFVGAILAKKLHKPLYLHEQNVDVGDANKLAILFAKKMFMSFDIKSKSKKMMYVGNPRMDECITTKSLDNKFNILFFAGSLASSSLNKVIEDLLKMEFGNKIYLHIISGKKQYEKLKKYEKSNIKIIAYEKNMLPLMAKMDLIIMRAGATSLAEIIALEKVSILIPSPNVKHNHQEHNAKYLLEKEAALMIKEEELTSEKLFEKIKEIHNDYMLQIKISNNIKKLKKQNVCEEMIKEIAHG